MLTSSLLPPDEMCLFFGYRNPAKDDARDIYHSISHWLESEKFRSTDEILREAVIQSPNPIEARKLATRHQDKWRIDWRSIRARTLKSGIMMAAEQNIDVRLRLEQFARTTPLEVNVEFIDGKTLHGHPLNWYAGVMWDAAESYINHSVRALFVAGRKVNYSGKRTVVDRFLPPTSISHVLVPIAKDTSNIGEAFALQHHLPVKYFYGAKGKFSSLLVRELAQEANQILVLEHKGGKQFDQLIMQAKALNKPVKLTLV